MEDLSQLYNTYLPNIQLENLEIHHTTECEVGKTKIIKMLARFRRIRHLNIIVNHPNHVTSKLHIKFDTKSTEQ